jgi:MSHA biogenesis protein MshQ
MVGNTEFIVKPLGFYIHTSDTNPEATDANGGVFKKAGENFNLQIDAVCWTATTDSDNDGYLDDGVDASGNIITKNYNSSSIPIYKLLIAPNPANDNGSISITSADFDNGSFLTDNQTFSEVGIIKFNVVDSNYISSGETVKGTSVNFGRFTPHHFKVEIENNGTFEPSCGNSFTYTGQKFYYDLIPPILKITAENKNNSTTQNYENNFMKLTESGITIDNASDNYTIGTNGDYLDINYNINTGIIDNSSKGVIFYKFSTSDEFSYLRDNNSKINPFYSNIKISLTEIKDSDNITDNGNLPYINPTSILIRYGRIEVFNNFGPETENIINSPFEAQYWKDNKWIRNQEDNCTNNEEFCPNSRVNISTHIENGNNGRGFLTISSNNVEENFYVCPVNPNYLSNCTICPCNDDSCGLITFGIYRGRDRIIGWEEIPAK